MKKTSVATDSANQQPPSHARRKSAELFALSIAVLILSGGGRTSAAQFPSAPENEPAPTANSIQSAGVVQITLSDAKMVKLMEQGSYTYQYVGWKPLDKTVTSPILYDPDTHIAVSQAHQREVFSAPGYFGVTVGVTAGGFTADTIPNYNDYIYPDPSSFVAPFDFQVIPGASGQGPDEVLTEMQEFTLATISQCGGGSGGCSNNCPPPPPQLPTPPPSALPFGTAMVRAGYDNHTYNIAGGNNYLRKSIGMVQSKAAPVTTVPNASLDFLANSFFNMFVEVTLPLIPNSLSGAIFPLAGAVLTNEQPLIIVGEDLANLPPGVVYIHKGNSALQPFAVNLVFRDTCLVNDPATGQPYYSAGDTFGTVVLAGHGLLDPCSKTTALEQFVNKVFGPPGELAPKALVGRTFPDASFPSAAAYFESAQGTNFGGTSVDCTHFTNGASVLTARNFRISGLTDPISLPSLGNSVVYTNPSTTVSFEISNNGTNFIGAQGTGPMSVLIVSTNSPIDGITNYYQELQVLNITGTSGLGTVKVRESPSKASSGQEIVQAQDAGTFKIGGYIDGTLESSFNNGISYQPASRPIRLEQVVPVCGTAGQVTVALSGSSVVLSWASSTFRLQGTASLTPINWVDLPGSAPYTVAPGSPYHYFRLVCP